MTAPPIERPAVTAPPPDRLLTRREVADLLRVSERTVDRLAADGKLTRQRVAGSARMIRYRESQVRALLDQAED